ncbi:hypothetical protein [Rubripirellula reticaptiva]|uniref:Uncharacterized protein n=1 Tax=Rubripirellula reticaptiva TaxID=2528013 RepID=A0A5C6EQI5_9BACT|nr:hypothetical protein [Rubripirellula reticaptiva]TWU49866.1 hypothetical protein Poly59_44910 [Rubripirellula reticaptiva]
MQLIALQHFFARIAKQMDDIVRRLRVAKDPRNPALLAEAFAVAAKVLDSTSVAKKSTRWKAKADAEVAKAKR